MAHGVRVAALAAAAAAWAVVAAGVGSGSGMVGVEPPVGWGLELGGMLAVVDPGSTLTDCRSVQSIHNNIVTVLHQYHDLL